MMKKLLFLLVTLSVLTSKAQSLSNLVFDSTITPSAATVNLTFDFDGVSAGDTFEWRLFLALPDGSPDWGSGRNVAYLTAIVPDKTGSGTQTVSLGIYNILLMEKFLLGQGKLI